MHEEALKLPVKAKLSRVAYAGDISNPALPFAQHPRRRVHSTAAHFLAPRHPLRPHCGPLRGFKASRKIDLNPRTGPRRARMWQRAMRRMPSVEGDEHLFAPAVSSRRLDQRKQIGRFLNQSLWLAAFHFLLGKRCIPLREVGYLLF